MIAHDMRRNRRATTPARGIRENRPYLVRVLVDGVGIRGAGFYYLRRLYDGRIFTGSDGGARAHVHESWQIRESASGGTYCAACGEKVTEAAA